jgi:uncharacterized protein YuzE
MSSIFLLWQCVRRVANYPVLHFVELKFLKNCKARVNWKSRKMNILYDKATDTMTITLRDEKIRESDEIRPGVIADFGYDGGIVRFEILSASKVMTQPKAVNYEMQGA